MLRITTLLRDAREHDEGFSIVEVLVAMTVFALIAAGVATGIVGSLYLAQGSRSREVAIGLAQDAIDQARTSTNLFGVVDKTSQTTIGNMTYTVTQVARWIPTAGTGNACGAGGGPLAYKRVSMTVSWTASGRGATQSIAMNSMVAPSTSVTAANLGTVIVSVTRAANGAGNQGVSVSITPNASNPSGATAITSAVPQTDATGCSYALNVKPGRYDVTLTKSGNIDDGTSANSLGTQTTAPSATVTVGANQTSAANFNYDSASTYTLKWQDPTNTTAAMTLPTSAPVTLRRKTTDIGPLTTTTTQAFPFTDGYRAVAGSPSKCLSTDPVNWPANGAAVVPPVAAVAPANAGDPVTAYAPVQAVQVTLADPNDNVLTATTTTPVANSGDPGCATTTTYTFTGVSKNPTVALPYGTYTFSSGKVLKILGGIIQISFSPGTANATPANGVTITPGKTMLDPRRVPTP
ncbi:prepilin-type N-terminal cleavage/methylation domain-containing protein [Curtobacterium sp. 9128]|uniref:prepilin-type N-terminal cleavage/methylation domain-containing protein n=1 Tax=Curtobacterium sp. 9128 TaxID=1793722 RepID=UPI0037BE8D83